MRLSEIRERLREVATDDYKTFIKRVSYEIKYTVNVRQRRLVVLSGEDPVKLAGVAADVVIRYIRRIRTILGSSKKINILYVFHDEFPDARLRTKIVNKALAKHLNDNIIYKSIVYEISNKFLGTTQQILIMDLVNDLKPNDVGRLIGTVEGGGLIIFLTPPLHKWNEIKTIFRSNLAVPSHPEPRKIFIKWFIRKLKEHKGIYIFDTDQGKLIKSGKFKPKKKFKHKKIQLPEIMEFDKNIYELALTQDQVEVIKLIEKHLVPKVKKGKRVTIIITADRGRGKSSAIGIGIVGFIAILLRHKNRVRVGVTAEEPLAVQSLMMLAEKALNSAGMKYRVIKRGDNIIELKGERFSIEYWSPLDILKLNLDVVIVDEAAGLAVPLLHKIWLKFRRTIFATTIHGYEGVGRGFSVRFLKRIKEDERTKLIQYEMVEPIRYSIDDPIERFQFDVLLLDAEPDELDNEDLKLIEEGAFEYLKLDPEFLFSKEGEKILRSLFGIYVLAHYRNEPDDLGRLADAPHHSIRAVMLKSGKIVGAVQLAEEGKIPENYIDELLIGGKIPGNIIPDRLLKHLRKREFGRGIGWRIVRIAVHNQVQGKGIGSFLLQKVIEEAKELGYDWVGSGFGVNRELLNFWLKNGFKVLHMSPDRNPVSGEYTVLVLTSLNEEWKKLIEYGVKEFTLKFLESLHAVYRDFEPDTAYLMFSTHLHSIEVSEKIELSETQLNRLKIYVSGIMTFESVCDAVTMLTKKCILRKCMSSLSKLEGQILIIRALQGRSWDAIFDELGVSRVRSMNIMRRAVAKMLNYLYKIETSLPEE
jgi:tRNA(Met) cytidine acetyltransferase